MGVRRVGGRDGPPIIVIVNGGTCDTVLSQAYARVKARPVHVNDYPLCAPRTPLLCFKTCVSSLSLCAGKLTQSIFSLGDRVLGDAARLDDACPGDYSYYDGSCYKL